ncbi:peptidase S8 [Tubulinosema ratisbonensis]|uniref:Peptidase S8 n=1 Tax=Tubulinosema ratisbonensis TaxID=291195 RepID=A0A437ANT6_9MICR|nr:peptidase S8 [Tubulinosema ratisbonensis]
MILFYISLSFLKKCYLAQHKKQNFSELKSITNTLQIKDIKKINNSLLRICTNNLTLLQEYFDRVEEDYSYQLAHFQESLNDSLEESDELIYEPEEKLDEEIVNDSYLPDHLFKISKYTNTVFNNYFFNFPIFNLVTRFFMKNEFDFTGKGIKIYILDKTNTQVKELKGRLVNLFRKKDYFSNSISAILAAGSVNGFAKESTVYILNSVKRNNRISLSKLIQSLQRVPLESKTILLLSAYGVKSEILNEILEEMYKKGVFIITPAGNNSDNACLYSPPSSMFTISVGSVNDFCNKLVYSNYGNCVSLYTLGEVNNFSGTSVSASIFTGLVAMYMDQFNFLNNNQLREQILRSNKFINSLMIMEYPNKLQVNEVYMVKLIYLFLVICVILFILFIIFRKKSELIVQPLESDSSFLAQKY